MIPDHTGLFLVFGSVIAMAWQRVRTAMGALFSLLIQTEQFHYGTPSLAVAVDAAIKRDPWFPLAMRVHYGHWFYRHSTQQRSYVPMCVPCERYIGWYNRRPVFVSYFADAGMPEPGLRVTFIRGTLNRHKLLADAARIVVESTQHASTGRPLRFNIRTVTGRVQRHGPSISSGGDQYVLRRADASDASDAPRAVEVTGPQQVLLRCPIRRQLSEFPLHDPADLRLDATATGSSLDRLALNPAALEAVERIRRWRENSQWYHQRDIPWRHGLLLYGEPGNGKSRLVAALGHDLDMPIVSFDLGSLSNEEFTQEWAALKHNAPCIALFEDIDAVFHQRQSQVKHDNAITFDCFINALGGVDIPDGVLTVITTNCFEQLDSAVLRPGRIDDIVEMSRPNWDGRYRIAKNVLFDLPEKIDAMVELGVNDSGARFLQRCQVVALEAAYGKQLALPDCVEVGEGGSAQ